MWKNSYCIRIYVSNLAVIKYGAAGVRIDLRAKLFPKMSMVHETSYL